MDSRNKNVLVLAYLGDSVYELNVRNFLISKGISNVKELQQKAVEYVSAKNQCAYLTKMMNQNFLMEEELDIVKRARNHKVAHKPKSTDIITYKYATGLEALIGYLYLENKIERINEIMNFVLGE